ncbi:glycosyltransferase [Litorivicinus lipolyticus]|uniref:Glycosyltransferase n=1 Tax=Litorivicinus lipolyticus TaxID=418701 RepID=A0A5Q2Q7Y8_9GAMM|nr:glycosyltransferase family 2 protein [Litorivicinus lipolyticus]QGG79093.1 glycosyltransferase [Litorivicinus lipolyticus]
MTELLPISAVIITKNEAHNIERCLASVSFCAQIVVLDSGSTDDTVRIARDLGADVSVTDDWPGFGPQKNRALALATQPWVLSIDADEWVEPELAGSIKAHLSADQPAEILRASSFCGRVMKHSGWGDDWVLRLFPRAGAAFSDDLVHERVLVDGAPVRLVGVMGHETYRTLADGFRKAEMYASAWAAQKAAAGLTASPSKALLKGGFALFRTLILKQGFRDGSAGLALSVLNGAGTAMKYLYLWEKGRG